MIAAAMAVSAALAASCGKADEPAAPAQPAGGTARVDLVLENAESFTRAFFDETAAAEPWESKITHLSVYSFDRNGRQIGWHKMSAHEIGAKFARLSLPDSVAGTTCSFYVAANTGYHGELTAAAMESMTERVTLDYYNGPVSQVTNKAMYANGFVMTGKAAALIDDTGASTKVSVTLRRTVAKIAVRTKVDESFRAAYGGGTVVIDAARISKVSAGSYSFFDPARYRPRTSFYEYEQASEESGGYRINLFYAFESGPLTGGDRLVLTLKGYFDADGSEATASDRSPVEYEVDLNDSAGGEIRRNGYYRVDAVIRGLSGRGVEARITAADWETPATQTIDLGD
jgi:hypothetical protein